MKVHVAEEAGFCFGVKRALEIIERLHEEGHKICVYGQLIHNSSVLNDLKAKGIDCIESLDELDPDKTLIIRTHGIPKETEKDFHKRGIRFVDATCPLVKKLQGTLETIAKDTSQLVIVGDKKHPEIIAAVSYAAGARLKPVIINSEEEAHALSQVETISIAAQTTLDTDFFNTIINILKTKAKKLHIYDTICNATRVRQAAIKKLAPEVDAVVIVGGKNSSNTKKLFNIALKQNKNTFHIESSDELYDPDFSRSMKNFQSIGITAGASTPPEEIEKTKNYFKKFTIEKEMNHG